MSRKFVIFWFRIQACPAYNVQLHYNLNIISPSCSLTVNIIMKVCMTLRMHRLCSAAFLLNLTSAPPNQLLWSRGGKKAGDSIMEVSPRRLRLSFLLWVTVIGKGAVCVCACVRVFKSDPKIHCNAADLRFYSNALLDLQHLMQLLCALLNFSIICIL